MTMLDDNRLAELFGRAAETFEVPSSGPNEILARAERAGPGGTGGDDPGEGDGADAGEGAVVPDELGRRRRLVAAARHHRILSVAACVVVVLVVAGTIGAFVRSPSNPTVTSLRGPNLGGAKGAGGAVSGLPTTTAPAVGTHAPAGRSTVGGAVPAPAPISPSTSGSGTPNQTSPALPPGAVGQPAKIEQTGTLGLTVKRDNVAATLTRLTALAGSVGGFVANSQSQSGSGGTTPQATITMQVPVDDFASVLKAAEQYGKDSNVSTKATDVSGQYFDLQARLTALQDSRQQYLTILAKATSIGDILSVQEQLDSIQQQIEQLQGQLQLLDSETSYSTLTVTVNGGMPPPPPGPVPESGLVQAWHDSVGGFVAGVDGAVRVAGPFLFALLCLALVAVGGRVLWRRYQRHRL